MRFLDAMADAARARADTATREGLSGLKYWRAVVMASLGAAASNAVGQWQAPDSASPELGWHVAPCVDWASVPHGTPVHVAPPEEVVGAHVLAAFEAGWMAHARGCAGCECSGCSKPRHPVGSPAYFEAMRAVLGVPLQGDAAGQREAPHGASAQTDAPRA